MYESYWQLDAKPFENSSDTRFYFPAEGHQGTLLKLHYAIQNRRGGALLAGAPGLGKTLLVHTLIDQLPDHCSPVIHLVFPQMPADQLLAYVADQLTGERSTRVPSVHDSVARIDHTLQTGASEGRHAVIVIDEAQLLRNPETLETLRLLLNFEYEGRPALTLMLTGQTALLPMLERMPELDERLSVKCLLRPFDQDETIGYVNHRLAAAGAERPIFDQSALETLQQLSHGVPRRINRLADLALLVGFAEERTSISADQIESVAEELTAVVAD